MTGLPAARLDALSIYRLEYPEIGRGFILRTATGDPIDKDWWTKRRFAKLLDRAGCRARARSGMACGTGT